MHLTCSLIGREIIASALAIHKNLSLESAALARRLNFSEKEAKEALATNKFLTGTFEAISTGEVGDQTVEIVAVSSAHTLRVAIVMWVQMATKKDQSVHQLTLDTDFAPRQSEAQKLVDQLAEQLSLPVTDVVALAAQMGAKPKAEKKERAPKKAAPGGPALVQ